MPCFQGHAMNFDLPLPCTCSDTAVHLLPNLVTIRNPKPCSDTAMHL